MVQRPILSIARLASCVVIALVGVTCPAAPATYTATIANWFAPGNPYGNTYFGSTIDDDQVFVYITTGGGSVEYLTASSTTTISNGNVYNLESDFGGSSSGTFTMVDNTSARFVFGFGSKTGGTVTQPSNFVNGTDPTTPYYAGALGLFEWDNHLAGYENMDVSYEYNSGFPMSYVVVDGTGGSQRIRSSGIKAGTAAGIVDSLKTNFAALNPAFAIKNSGTNSTGAPSNPYPTSPVPPYNALAQNANGPYLSNNQTAVVWGGNNVSGLAEGDVWKGDTNYLGTPASGTSPSVPSYSNNMYHVGNSFTGYFAYLATHNSGTYSIDFTGNGGYSATLGVTDTGTGGYQLSVTNIRHGVTFNTDGSYVAGTGTAVGSFSFFAQNAVIPPGNAISGNTNDSYVGQWNDLLVQSGAPTTVDLSTVNLTTSDSTGLISSICASISCSMQYGILGSPTYQSSLSGTSGIQGTNWWFNNNAGGLIDKSNVNSTLFANLWTTVATGTNAFWDEYLRTMLQATGTFGEHEYPPYFYSYADRLNFMSPDIYTDGNAAISINLGAVTAVPEPSTVALLSVAGFVAATALRRRCARTLVGATAGSSGPCL